MIKTKAKIQDKVFNVTGDQNKVSVDNVPLNADVFEYANGKFHIIMNNKSYDAEVLTFDKDTKTCVVKINGKEVTVALKDRYDELLHEIGIDETSGKKVRVINAPMPGMVLQVMVESGQHIRKGDAIVVLEAMKMENILKSPADGIVRKIHVIKGDKVEKNQVMVNLD